VGVEYNWFGVAGAASSRTSVFTTVEFHGWGKDGNVDSGCEVV